MQPTAIAQAASEALAGQERLHRGGLAQGRLDRHIAGGLTSPELAQMAGTPQRPGIAKSLSERLVPKTDPQQR